MERFGLLIAVLGNITALVYNIISQMCRTYRAYHARRRRCVGILLMSENQVNRCSSICKSKTSKQRKHWIRPGRTSLWWDNFVNNTVVLDEWRENFRMSSFFLHQQFFFWHFHPRLSHQCYPPLQVHLLRKVVAPIHFRQDYNHRVSLSRCQSIASAAGHPDHSSAHLSNSIVTTLPPPLRLPESTAFR